MQTVAMLAEMTKRETEGYFNLTTPEGKFNPVGIVKGWAIKNAADLSAQCRIAKIFLWMRAAISKRAD